MKKTKSEVKYERIYKTIKCITPDRVPITDFFWKGFIEKWRECKKTEEDIYLYYDLDLVVQFPNIEPRIQRMEILERGEDSITFKTGFGYVIRSKKYTPMPQYIEPMIKDPDEYRKIKFDDPGGRGRFYDIRDDLLNLGEGTEPAPSFMESFGFYGKDICVFGGTLEPHEYIMRLRGQEELLIDLITERQAVKEFVPVVTDFIIENCKKQIDLAGVKGFFLGGDVAYDRGMLFSPDIWRDLFKPEIHRICEFIHANGAVVIYHGCGDMRAIFDDLIECGVDCVNPLQVSAGMDVVELKKIYGNRLSFMGNISVRDVLETGGKNEVRNEVFKKLNAAKHSGYIAMSDHSISSDVKIDNYDYMVRLIRDNGVYPL